MLCSDCSVHLKPVVAVDIETVGLLSVPCHCLIFDAPEKGNGYRRWSGNGYAHHAVYEAVNGSRTPGMVIMHTCDVRSCINWWHLKEGTYGDNTRDMWDKGRGFRSLKVSDEDVKEIRRLKGMGRKHYNATELAVRYGVHRVTIGKIASGAWR